MFAEKIFGAELQNWAILLELVICGTLVAVVGSRLTHLADALSDKYNLGKAWIGVILLATITSLPELVTGGTSVILGQPDLAFGNIFGSCMFNVAIIVLINHLLPGGSVFQSVRKAHSLSSALGILMMALAVLSFTLVRRLAGPEAQPAPAAGIAEWICCALIFVMYPACMRMTYRFELREDMPLEEADVPSSPVNLLGFKIGLFSVLLILCTIWLTQTGDVLEKRPIALLGNRTLGATFVGALFLAIATSLPEIVTSITAVRMGHLDMALGNIFGSNMFNIFVIPFLKIVSFTRGEPLLYDASFSTAQHTMTGMFAILITSVAVAGLVYRTKRRVLRFGFDSFLIGVIYIIGMALLLLT